MRRLPASASSCLPALAAATLTASIAVGCRTTEEVQEDETSASALGERAGSEQLLTTEPGVKLFDGYNTVFDGRRDPCVHPSTDDKPLVGQPTQQTTVQLVQSEAELARELGLDASLTLRAPLGTGEATARVLRSFKGSSQDVNYLLQTVHSYTVTVRSPASLTVEAREVLDSAPRGFLARCGDRFVTSITFQARLVALLTFSTRSEDRALSLDTAVRGNAPVGPVVLDGSIKARFSDLAKRQDVESTMHVVAQGFDLDAPNGLLGVGGNIEEKLAKMDEAAARLAEAVREDRARDVESYTTRNDRRVIPGAVGLSRYGTARGAGALVDTEGPFKESQDELRKAERFLRKLGEIRHRIDRAWKIEVKDFLDAGAEAQVGYNVMPPAKPKRDVAELRSIAAEWARRFRSDDPTGSGTDVEALDEAMAACANDARSGAFGACALEMEPTSHPAYARAAAALDEYLASGRIVKLRHTLIEGGTEMSYRSSMHACEDVQGFRDRLPTPEEAELLAPLVATIPGRSVWVSGLEGCSWSASGMAYYANSAGEEALGCERWSLFWGTYRGVVCVPQGGPIGKRDLLF